MVNRYSWCFSQMIYVPKLSLFNNYHRIGEGYSLRISHIFLKVYLLPDHTFSAETKK